MSSRAVVLALCAAACHGRPIETLTPAQARTLPDASGQARVVVGDATYAFSPGHLSISRGGAVSANVPFEVWGAGATGTAAAIPALDGDGRWIVVSAPDAIYRVTAAGELAAITDQLGLAGERFVAVAAAGALVAIATSTGVAISRDGKHLERYAIEAPRSLAVAPHKVALALADHVEEWDLAAGTRTRFAVKDAKVAFVDGKPEARLVVAARDLTIERDGELVPLALPGATSAPAIAHGAPEHGDDTWTHDVAPIFQRVCAHCHLPGGDAGFDLSTATSWRDDRDELLRRVIDDRTMPPAGTQLSDVDRAVLARWLAGSAAAPAAATAHDR